MPTYKLTYFDIRGLGESLRLLLTYGGIEFEDNRLQRENWPQVKKDYPLEQLPVLDIDNKRIYQSGAIARYLAKLVKLNGANDWEDLQIDIAAQTVGEIMLKMRPYLDEKDDARKEKLFKTFKEEFFDNHWSKIDKIAKENGGYLANSKLSWADLQFVSIIDAIASFCKEENFPAKYPNLMKVVNHVKLHPNLKKYFETRKESPY